MNFYALSDTFATNPREYTAGFANTTIAIAFASRSERDAYVRDTKLTKARAIARAYAAKLTKPTADWRGDVAKRVGLYNAAGDQVLDASGNAIEITL